MSSKRNVIDLRSAKKSRSKTTIFATPFASRPHRRASPLKMRKRRVRAALALGVLVGCIGFAYAIHHVSYLPRFTVSSVAVEGEQRLSERLVRAYAESVLEDGSFRFISRDNFLVYPKDALAAGVAASFPRIESAEVDRDSVAGTTLVLTIREREPYALWCEEVSGVATSTRADCYVMDEGGYVYAKSGEPADEPSTSYVFTGGLAATGTPIGMRFAPDHIDKVRTLLDALAAAGYSPTGAKVVGGEDYFVPLQAAPLLKISFASDPSTVMRNLELVLASEELTGKLQKIEYVDLRFGNRVYYKLKGEEEVGG
jgi:hypothetical protein